MKKGRRGPADGYDVGAKPHYRRWVWNRLLENIERVGTSKALLMPSKEGTEIEVCESKGLKRENLFCVDDNAAIAATLSRRWPGIHAFGTDVLVAARRIVASGHTIDVAHLDFTGSVSIAMFVRIREMCKLGLWSDGATVSVVFLRGRETGRMVDYFERLSSTNQYLRRDDLAGWDKARRLFIARAFGGSGYWLVGPPRVFTYKSAAGSQSMGSMVLNVSRSVMGKHCPKYELMTQRKYKLVRFEGESNFFADDQAQRVRRNSKW